MKKLNVPAKSKGALLFAFNTLQTNYVNIAEQSARLIKHTLGIPVSLVTDTDISSGIFDQVIPIENQFDNYHPGALTPTPWRNGSRYRAYELSPYDQTLLLDSDYLILEQNLLKLFEQDYDYRIMTHNQKPDAVWNDKMGIYSHQYQWATVVLFDKTPKSNMLFKLAGRIQRNYLYYLNLYQISRGNFRNDYAFTIANNILNGYDLGMDQGIPWPMLTFAEVVNSITVKNSMLVVKEPKNAYVIPRQNIHVMDKGYLLSDNFKQFVDTVCAE